MIKQFGGKVNDALLERYAKSSNWEEGKFQNLEETSMSFSIQDLPNLMYKQFFDTKGRMPKISIPIMPFKDDLKSDNPQAQFIWFGHSVLYIQLNGKTLLIDPMLGPNASPIAPFTTKRFSEDSLQVIDDLPEIDLVLFTHDHYDHLDLASFEKLKGKVKHYFVALGVKRHLTSWGVSEQQITEFDWWEQQDFEGINITFTPTRHFSGRGLTDRAKSMWGGWVFKTAEENIYFSGDGGYGEHFKSVGEKLGPFDIGFMECGQYNKNWHQIHMYPEECIEAAIDAGVKKAVAVHWAGFALAQHHWKDPIERFTKKAEAENFPIITPQIGELFSKLDEGTANWWNHYE